MTSDVRVALKSSLTRAHWPVVLDEAVGVRSTVTWVTAHSVDTSFSCWAVTVGRAAWRYWQYDGTTLASGVRYPSLGARTRHGPQRNRVEHQTPGRGGARHQLTARVQTLLR